MDTNQLTEKQLSMERGHNKTLVIVSFLCILFLVSFGSFFLGKQTTSQTKSEEDTQKSTQTPTSPVALVSSVPTITQSIEETTMQTYTDTDIPFSISYPKNWILKKTYGKGTGNQSPTVLSGIEIDSPSNIGTFVVNVINSKNASSIIQWWQTGAHTAFTLSQPNFSFEGIDAIKVSSTPGGNPPARVEDETYFLWKGNVYLLSMQYTPKYINTDLVNMYNSFTLPQE